MSKIELKIVGDDPGEIAATLDAMLTAITGNGGADVSKLSVKELTEELKRQLPSMDITMTPKAKASAEGGEAAAPAKRGRPKKEAEAEPEADPFAAAEDKKPAVPEITPAEARKQAVDILMAAYNDKAKQPNVLALLKKYGVKKFAEVGDDKAGDLLADAKAI